MDMTVELDVLEDGTSGGRGKAAVDALKRQAESRELLDKLGLECRRQGGMNRSCIRDAVGGDWGAWNRLVRTVGAGVQSDAVIYGRAKWPEVMQALEREADLRKGRGSADDDEGTLMRTSLTFTQKLLVCLRRIAEESDLDLEDASGNDARCYRFTKKLVGKVEKEDETDLDRFRMLHLETIRLMDLKTAEGVSLRKAAAKEAQELLEWVEDQPDIEGKMRVPKVGDGMSVSQLQASMAAKLVVRGAEEKTIVRNVGVTSSKARRLAREAVKKSQEDGDRTKGRRAIKDRREAIEQAEVSGRFELASAMADGQTGVGAWIGQTDALLMRISAHEARFVTTDVEEAKTVVEWLSREHGPGVREVSVRVTRKDTEFLAEGFVHAIRKTLELNDTQVRMESFSWKADVERIERTRSQIVMSVEVTSAEATGRLRGMYKLAKTMCKSRDLSAQCVCAISVESWRAVVDAMERAKERPVV